MMRFFIGGVEKTDQILISSFSLQTSSGQNTDSIDFDSKQKFNLFDEIEVKNENNEKIFGGIILNITQNQSAGDIILYKTHAVDYTCELDKKLVNDTYLDMKIGDIIQAIVTKYCSGFTYSTNITTDLIVGSIAFELKYPTECFKELCDLTGFSWYCDYDKKVHYFN